MGMTGSPDTGTGDWSLLGVNGSGAMMELLQFHQSCVRVEEMPAYCSQHIVNIRA